MDGVEEPIHGAIAWLLCRVLVESGALEYEVRPARNHRVPLGRAGSEEVSAVGRALAELTVRNHVRARKRALGLIQRETFVPQSYVSGHEAQVDWYEAWADLGGERTRVQVFAMRSMASGAAFHRAYLHATQQAFLEAHEHAFA